nr:hypothetical protein [Tanacetum cinerariifolium]
LPPATAPVVARHALVVSAHPLASQVGRDIMQQGGNAYDAAVAVQFALAVVHPSAGNIGGGGFLVYRGKGGAVGALDFREVASVNATRDMYLDSVGNVVANASTLGRKAVGVPGTVAGMVVLHKKLGKLPWAKLIAPSVRLARQGVVLTEKEAEGLNASREAFLKYSQPSGLHRLYTSSTKNPVPNLAASANWKAGDLLKQPDLAATLERIQLQGRDGFYKGKTADLLLDETE